MILTVSIYVQDEIEKTSLPSSGGGGPHMRESWHLFSFGGALNLIALTCAINLGAIYNMLMLFMFIFTL